MPKVPAATGPPSYGYQHKAQALPQFYSVLNLDATSDEAKIARNNLDELRQEYLDLDKTTSKQTNEMEQMKAEIMKRYPDLYGGSKNAKKLYFAMRTIVYLHLTHRGKISQAAKVKHFASQSSAAIPQGRSSHAIRVSESPREAHALSPRPPVLSTPSGGSNENSRSIQIVSRTYFQQRPSTSNPAPRSRSKFHPVYKTASAHPRTQTIISRGLGLATPCTLFNSSQEEGLAAAPSSLDSLPSPLDSEPSQCLSPTSGGRGFTVVRSFLTSCRPNMEKYLHRFIDFGCRTDEYLSSMAAWQPDRQVKVLKKILSDSDGTPLGNEMDVEILQAQLDTYCS